jgi:hypothetical protein
MKKLRVRLSSKLKSTAGESIAEVLIALLIAALALTMLASVISTSARIITSSKAAMNAYYQKRNGLDAGTSTSGTPLALQITKKLRSDSAPGERSIGVKLKQDQESTIISVNPYSISDAVTVNTPVVAYYWP